MTGEPTIETHVGWMQIKLLTDVHQRWTEITPVWGANRAALTVDMHL